MILGSPSSNEKDDEAHALSQKHACSLYKRMMIFASDAVDCHFSLILKLLYDSIGCTKAQHAYHNHIQFCLGDFVGVGTHTFLSGCHFISFGDYI